MTLIAFALAGIWLPPIGGADMPVMVSMLNSYSGWGGSGGGLHALQ
ncbi:NAD(P)(+) transhydrogenase (Re/Si-specific) subunit beta [Shigella flexneri]